MIKTNSLKELSEKVINFFSVELQVPKELETDQDDFEEIKQLVGKMRYSRWLMVIVNPLVDFLQKYLQVFVIYLQSSLSATMIQHPATLTFQVICHYILYNSILQLLLKQFHYFITCNVYKNFQDSQYSILQHVLNLDYQFFEVNKTPQISNQIMNGNSYIQHMFQPKNIIQSALSLIALLGQLLFLIQQCPPIIFISMTLISTTLILIRQSHAQKAILKYQNDDQRKSFQEFVIDDALKNITTIKSFGTEKKEVQYLYNILKNNASIANPLSLYDQAIQFLHNSDTDIFTLLLLIYLLIIREIDPDQTQHLVANFSLLLSHSCSIHLMITYLIGKYKKRQTNNTSSNLLMQLLKISKLLKYKSTIPTSLNDIKVDNESKITGHISFQNVKFAYPITFDIMASINQIQSQYYAIAAISKGDSRSSSSSSSSSSSKEKEKIQLTQSDKQKERDINAQILKIQLQSSNIPSREILHNIQFEIKSGQFVSFVGKSGSGKSTIIKLIQRFYEVTCGDVCFDGKNIKEIPITKLKSSIGYVSQDSCLLDLDIEHNIVYGCIDEYTASDLKEACDISGVSEFVYDKKRFPLGMKTLVGSNGAKLSGGQKQRIAIARALIRKPQILILDEATSSLDAESEHLVQKYIDKLVEQRGMTIIVVAHRLSTIIKSDVIFVMQLGSIVQKGTHSQLLNQNGVYTQLIQHQINL